MRKLISFFGYLLILSIIPLNLFLSGGWVEALVPVFCVLGTVLVFLGKSL